MCLVVSRRTSALQFGLILLVEACDEDGWLSLQSSLMCLARVGRNYGILKAGYRAMLLHRFHYNVSCSSNPGQQEASNVLTAFRCRPSTAAGTSTRDLPSSQRKRPRPPTSDRMLGYELGNCQSEWYVCFLFPGCSQHFSTMQILCPVHRSLKALLAKEMGLDFDCAVIQAIWCSQHQKLSLCV